MNRIGKVLYPEAFHGKYIRTHWQFEDDLKGILERSGQKSNFTNKYKQRLRFLDERSKECVQRRSWFEKLRHVQDLWAIIFDKDEKNIRVLFSFVTLHGVEYAILLYVFEEKDRKTSSRYSYSSAIPIAQKRLEEVDH